MGLFGKKASRRDADEAVNAFNQDINSEPIPELMDTDAALSAIREGHRQEQEKRKG